MARVGDVLDNVIRTSLREPIGRHEPSAAVREALMARAANAAQSVAGDSVPPLVDELREEAGAEALSWWEIERCRQESYASWSNPRLALGWLDTFREAKRCRLNVA